MKTPPIQDIVFLSVRTRHIKMALVMVCPVMIVRVTSQDALDPQQAW